MQMFYTPTEICIDEESGTDYYKWIPKRQKS